MNEEYVYISDPNDVRMLAQNEGNAPCRPSLEVMVESRKQEGLPVGITALQGTKNKKWVFLICLVFTLAGGDIR